MKHLLIAALALLLALLAPLAHPAPGDACSFLADPIEQASCRSAAADPATGAMFAKCADQMVRGVCEQLTDPFAGCDQLPKDEQAQCRGEIGAKVETFALADGRQVGVPKLVVFRVRGYSTANPQDLSMCHAAAAYCQRDPKGLECLVGRANWGVTRGWGQ